MFNDDARPVISKSGIIGADGGRPSEADSTAPRPSRQVEPPEWDVLRQAADIAKREHDYKGYWLARRLYLLAQAEAYESGDRP